MKEFVLIFFCFSSVSCAMVVPFEAFPCSIACANNTNQVTHGTTVYCCPTGYHPMVTQKMEDLLMVAECLCQMALPPTAGTGAGAAAGSTAGVGTGAGASAGGHPAGHGAAAGHSPAAGHGAAAAAPAHPPVPHQPPSQHYQQAAHSPTYVSHAGHAQPGSSHHPVQVVQEAGVQQLNQLHQTTGQVPPPAPPSFNLPTLAVIPSTGIVQPPVPRLQSGHHQSSVHHQNTGHHHQNTAVRQPVRTSNPPQYAPRVPVSMQPPRQYVAHNNVRVQHRVPVFRTIPQVYNRPTPLRQTVPRAQTIPTNYMQNVRIPPNTKVQNAYVYNRPRVQLKNGQNVYFTRRPVNSVQNAPIPQSAPVPQTQRPAQQNLMMTPTARTTFYRYLGNYLTQQGARPAPR